MSWRLDEYLENVFTKLKLTWDEIDPEISCLSQLVKPSFERDSLLLAVAVNKGLSIKLIPTALLYLSVLISFVQFSNRQRHQESSLYNAILPIVPPKLALSLRGPSFHEYLSSTSQISKLEFSRLSQNEFRGPSRR